MNLLPHLTSRHHPSRILLPPSLALIAFILPPTAVAATVPGDAGTLECGQLQRSVQSTVGDEDPALYRSHGKYVRAVATMVSAAVDAGTVSEDCGSCIVNQFARRIPVASQETCGIPSCRDTSPSPEEIANAVAQAVPVAPDAWTDPTDFETLLELVEAALGCSLRSADVESAATLAASNQCAEPLVNYCGPDNSNVNFLLKFVNVPACLNEACCRHDRCYLHECIDEHCFFTPQSRNCDPALFDACRGPGDCSLLDHLDPTFIFVCALVECLSGNLPFSSHCTVQWLARSVLCLGSGHCCEVFAGTAARDDGRSFPMSIRVSISGTSATGGISVVDPETNLFLVFASLLRATVSGTDLYYELCNELGAPCFGVTTGAGTATLRGGSINGEFQIFGGSSWTFQGSCAN